MNPDLILQKIANSPELIDLRSTPARIFILIAHLQLALRHPNNTGSSAAIAHELTENLAEALCDAVPEAKALIDMGWNPGNDVTRTYFDLEFPGGEGHGS